MTIADAYRRLGAVLSGLEAQGIDVSAVTPSETEDGEPLVVDLRITVPADPDAPEISFGGTPEREEVGADGGTRVAAAPDPSPPPAGTEERATDEGANETPDGTRSCDRSGCGAAFDTAAALTVHRLAEHDRPDEPLYQHEPALRAAYEAYDSFSSMTEALGVDVTAQTVRRNMMKAGIHDPDTGDGESADDFGTDDAGENADTGTQENVDAESGGAENVDAESGGAAGEQPVTDGSGGAVAEGRSGGTPPTVEGSERDLGSDTGSGPDSEPASDPAVDALPADLGVDDLHAAVVEGGSLRAAARRLDRSSEETRGLLDELGLLDQVHGRVATRPDREERATAFEDWLAEHRGEPTPDEDAGASE